MNRVRLFLSENWDAEVLTNGGDYHLVRCVNIDTGETVKKKFFSRKKAFRYAENVALGLDTVFDRCDTDVGNGKPI